MSFRLLSESKKVGTTYAATGGTAKHPYETNASRTFPVRSCSSTSYREFAVFRVVFLPTLNFDLRQWEHRFYRWSIQKFTSKSSPFGLRAFQAGMLPRTILELKKTVPAVPNPRFGTLGTPFPNPLAEIYAHRTPFQPRCGLSCSSGILCRSVIPNWRTMASLIAALNLFFASATQPRSVQNST